MAVTQFDGRDVTNRLPGTIFWATPFYVLMGSSKYPAIYPGAIAAAAASALAVAFAFALCCRLVSRRGALVAAALLAFATGTWTVSADELWTHGPAQAAVLLALLLAVRNQWLLAGVPAGFAILVRPHLGVVALILGVAAVVHQKELQAVADRRGCRAGGGDLARLQQCALGWHLNLWRLQPARRLVEAQDRRSDHRVRRRPSCRPSAACWS